MIIDYSAHNTWMECPAKWYEKYINKLQLPFSKGQREDALALGSLVHEGLRVWQTHHVVQIPEEIIEELQPTKECYHLALELVYGYARAYPEEKWALIFCEEPVTFPLRSLYCKLCGGSTWEEKLSGTMCAFCRRTGTQAELTGLAKIDSYFHVAEPTVIGGGPGGIEFLLNPGWWIHEYKTKSPDIPIDLYMRSWEMNLQASYQMMALRHRLQSEAKAKDYSVAWPEVQGVLVNVLEKPKRYIPKRKCQACNEYYEFYTWIPTGTGGYACPTCGTRSKLTPLREVQPAKPPCYYRIIVTRNEVDLQEDRQQIEMTGKRMVEMEAGGLHSEPWIKRSCVTFFPKRTCEYFGAHRNHIPTGEINDYVKVKEYRGLEILT